MGLLFMLGVIAVVFFLVKSLIGGIGAAVISGVLLFVWFLINHHAGTKGLVHANMRAYFVTRSQGSTHEYALNRVIRSRYPVSSGNQEYVSYSFHRLVDGRSRGERDDLELLIYTIFTHESGQPPTKELENKTFQMIKDSYDSMSSKYRLSLKNRDDAT